jgi:hypothetical protein
MSRGRQRVQQTDLAKTFRALAQAGVQARVEVDSTGKIVVYVSKAGCDSEPRPDPNEWATDDQN